jgi:PAS domain-containing protein
LGKVRLIPFAYSIVLWSAALVALAVSVIAFAHRAFPGGTSFALMMCAVVVWSSMSGFQTAVAGLSGKLLFAKLAYVGIANVAPLFLVFALRYSGWGRVVTVPGVALLWLLPLATTVLAATNEMHGLIWSRVAEMSVYGGTVLVSDQGPWYWISLGCFAMMVVPGSIFIVRSTLRAHKLYVRQTVILLTGVMVPWIGVIVGLSPRNPFPGLELPAVGFAVTGLLIVFGITRYRLLDLVPVARNLLVERLADGLLVLDEKDRIVDMNSSLQEICGIGAGILGKSVFDALPFLREPLALAKEKSEGLKVETSIPTDRLARHFDLRITALRDRKKKLGGWMIVLRDETARRNVSIDRERLITELRAALADIKVLRGLLPVCVHCRKIRDDDGYWGSIEQYVEEHTDAQFSHGLCDECMQKLYPDYSG